MSEALRREATSPETTAERLAALAKSEDPAVVERVGLNPNTPFEVLHKIWCTHPKTFTENPAVALFQLEDPGFLKRVPFSALRALVAVPSIDAALLHYAAQWFAKSLAAQIAANPSAAAETLELLLSDASEVALVLIAKHPNTSPETLLRLLGDGAPKVRLQALASPTLPSPFAERREALAPILTRALPASKRHSLELLCLLARCGSWLRCWVAEQPNTPAALLVAMLFSGGDPLCIKVVHQESLDPAQLAPIQRLPEHRTLRSLEELIAKHPSAPPALMTRLAAQAAWPLKAAITQNPNLPAELFEALSQDQEQRVLLALAAHPRLPLEILQRLLLIKNRHLSCLLIKHPKMTPEQLRPLFHPEHWKIRRSLAEDARTPPDLMARLIEDERAEVRAAARKNMNSKREDVARLRKLEEGAQLTAEEIEWLRERGSYVKRLLVAHPQTPRALVEQLAASDDPEERLAVARATDRAEILEVLARDPNKEVALWVAHNPKTPAAVLRGFIEREDDAFLFALAKNPATSPELFTRLYETQRKPLWKELAQNPSLPGALLQALCEHALRGDHELLAMLARNPHAPKEVYARLPRLPVCYLQQNLELRAVHHSGASPEGFTARTLSALIRAQDCDAGLIRWALASTHPEVLLAIVQAPNTPQDVLTEMLTNYATYQRKAGDEGLLSWLQRHPNARKKTTKKQA